MPRYTYDEIRALRDNGAKVTLACLYEQHQCRDGSKFVTVTDYPTGKTTMRIWPK